MKDHEISWSRIAPALQLEIFHNTRERLNEQKAVTLLGLDADDIKFIGKLVKEYQRQIEFEDDIRRKALAKQLEILMRADHTKPDEAMEATDALHDITEQQFAAVLQSDQVEFNVISSREMKTAHDFLEHKNLTIDLAGDWSSTYPGEWERSDEHPDNFLATFRAENLLRTVSNQKKARGVKGVTNVKDPAPARRPKPIKSSGRSLRSRASSEESTIIAEPKSSDNSTMPPPTSVKSRKPRSSQKIKPSPLKTELRHSVSPPAWDDSAQRIHQSTLLRSTPRRSLSGPTVRSRSSTVVSQDGLESGGLPRRLRSPSDLRPSRAKLEMQETGALLEGVRGLDPSSSRPHQSSSTPESSHDKHAKMVTFRLQSALLKDIEARHPAFTANSAVFTGLSTSITPHLSHGSSIISRSSMDPVQGSLQSLSLSNNISHQVGKALTNKLSDYKTSASDNEANHDVEIDYGRQQAMSGSGGSPSHSVVLPSIETDDYGHQNKTSTSPFYGTAHLLTPAATSPSKRGTLENDESEYSPSEGSNGHHEEGITGSQVRKSRKHPAGRLIAFKSTAAGKAVMESPKKGKNTGSTFSTKPDSTPTTPKKRQYKKKSAALQRRVSPEAAMAASIAADEARIRAEQQDDTTVTNANDNSGIGGEVQAEVHSQTPTSTAQTQPKPKARRGRPRTRPLPNTPATSATSNISSSAPSSASRNLSFSSSLVVGNTASATSIPSAPKARGTTATTATTPKTKTTRKYTKKETIATAPATSTGDVDGDADAEVITKKDANAKARISGGRKKTSASAGADTDAAAGSTAAGASGHSVVIGGGRNGKKK